MACRGQLKAVSVLQSQREHTWSGIQIMHSDHERLKLPQRYIDWNPLFQMLAQNTITIEKCFTFTSVIGRGVLIKNQCQSCCVANLQMHVADQVFNHECHVNIIMSDLPQWCKREVKTRRIDQREISNLVISSSDLIRSILESLQ